MNIAHKIFSAIIKIKKAVILRITAKYGRGELPFPNTIFFDISTFSGNNFKFAEHLNLNMLKILQNSNELSFVL